MTSPKTIPVMVDKVVSPVLMQHGNLLEVPDLPTKFVFSKNHYRVIETTNNDCFEVSLIDGVKGH